MHDYRGCRSEVRQRKERRERSGGGFAGEGNIGFFGGEREGRADEGRLAERNGFLGCEYS